MPDTHAFAAYPAPSLLDTPDGKAINQLLWGDYCRLLGETEGNWTKIRARGSDGWVENKDLQEERLLEVNFVDIGQGDGCFIVTPDDKFILIDAGESDNMYRFLRWRFNLRNRPDHVIDIDTAVLSHPDADHYAGFQFLTDSKQFRFRQVLHNGIVERAGAHVFGEPFEHKRKSYVACVTDFAALKSLFADPAAAGKKIYPKLMKSFFRCADDVRMISAEEGYVPGYGKSRKKMSLQVLGPVPEQIRDVRALLTFGAPGKTKNGHSVVLMLRYGKVKMLLGGDLNIPAEEYLLRHYTGLDPRKAKEESLVKKARKTFEADLAKACHHGSADFLLSFLRAVNPFATVVSSGDDEPHAHPRPDALGAFGKYSRGERPLIFSTEMARSSRESIKNPKAVRARLNQLALAREQAETPEKRARAEKAYLAALEELERSVATYGMITVRTDGEKIVIAQKLEQAKEGKRWDAHRLERDEHGELHYVSKH